MARLHALVAVGTRPEVIKLAPVIAECRRRQNEIRLTVCLSGQHRELVQPTAEYFGIAPDIDLGVMVEGQSLAALTARLLTSLDSIIGQHAPDCAIAQGDTTTVLCTALAAFYRRVPLVHVEAGLRTGDLSAPWPEEMNRRVTTLATFLHCAPTKGAQRNLLAEGVASERIVVTGNTVIDALLATVRRERGNAAHWAAKYPMLGSRRMVLITGHRRENHGAGLVAICAAILELAKRYREVAFLLPVHPNPHVRQAVLAGLSNGENIFLLPPVAYPEFVWLMDRSSLIITDSGGVQEEAPSLGKPVLVTRASTERPESLDCGAAKLVATNVDALLCEASKVLDGSSKWAEARRNPYGDGSAAKRIVDAMLAQLP
jgi:UDP-N-acetylglucosamine 2-epimerase (non-hydrolysing)